MHYRREDGCDGWHLVKTEELSVISERVPLRCKGIRFYYQKSQQSSFVLSQIGFLGVDGKVNF